MTFTEAAVEVLRLAGKPLHYKEITDMAVEKNLLSHVGKSPEVTMGQRLASLLKKEDKSIPIVRVRPGVFGLRDWSDKGGKSAATAGDESDEGFEINALEVEAAQRPDDEDAPVVSRDDKLRADLAAKGAEMFDDEDDDNEPILANLDDEQEGGDGEPGEGGEAGTGGNAGERGGRGRRRRRRGRGRTGTGTGGISYSVENAPMPEFTTSDATVADPNAPPPRPQIRERHQIMSGGPGAGIEVPDGVEVEELAGRELADAAILVFAGFDRNAGPIAVRNLVEALFRRGRLSGDVNVGITQLSASLRADNMRRLSSGLRPRFRFAAQNRVAPTDWLLSNDLVRMEQDVLASVERYREASRRMLLRKLQELPGHVFVELALLVLEKIGMAQIRSVKRAGSPGGEVHFSAIHRTSDDVRVGIVIRKDGREIGRERVTDLRGAFHHYNAASSGWVITTGQILSGAKEEANIPGSSPMALYDGMSFAKLLEENGVAVQRAMFPIAIPDLEFLETIRGA